MGGASAPTLFAQSIGIRQSGSNSVGAEAPPTKDLGSRKRLSDPVRELESRDRPPIASPSQVPRSVWPPTRIVTRRPLRPPPSDAAMRPSSRWSAASCSVP
ncbi:DUF6053 domain-containing protein [Lysobacter sp. CA199]|uniref:DUF6053 domain-containing protein n=1 Tax=Lysobacter sp. CA199 TaxID=3455608 RepID=UPI003F8D3CAF